MKFRQLLTIAAAVIFSAGIVMAAPSAASNAKTNKTSSTIMTTHHLTGTISSINNSDLVLSHTYKGKTEDSTFVLNSATKKEGTLAKGDRATVYYQINNKQNVATNVRASTSKKS